MRSPQFEEPRDDIVRSAGFCHDGGFEIAQRFARPVEIPGLEGLVRQPQEISDQFRMRRS